MGRAGVVSMRAGMTNFLAPEFQHAVTGLLIQQGIRVYNLEHF
jgi:hypothetical protein